MPLADDPLFAPILTMNRGSDAGTNVCFWHFRDGPSLDLPNLKMLFQVWNRKLCDSDSDTPGNRCYARPSNAMNAGMVRAAGAHPSPSSAATTFGGDIGRL